MRGTLVQFASFAAVGLGMQINDTSVAELTPFLPGQTALTLGSGA